MKQKQINIGDFCLVDGEGLEAFLVIGEDDTYFEVMSIDTGSVPEPKSKCHYLALNLVEVQTKATWVAKKNPYYRRVK